MYSRSLCTAETTLFSALHLAGHFHSVYSGVHLLFFASVPRGFPTLHDDLLLETGTTEHRVIKYLHQPRDNSKDGVAKVDIF